MRPRDEDGHFLSWEDALELRADPYALEAAVEGEAWAAWLLEIETLAEDSGLDPEGFDSYSEYEDAAEAGLPEAYEDYDDWWEPDWEYEVAVDTDGDTGGTD